MRKIFISGLICFLSFQNNVNAQMTSESEYNYIRYGIRTQLINGLDVKKENLNVDFNSKRAFNVSDYRFEFTPVTRLYGDGDGNLAGYFIYAYSSAWDNHYYLCLPFDYYMNEFYSEVDKWDEPMTTAFSIALAMYFNTSVKEIIEGYNSSK